jgi:site-specific DNA recombinase
VNTLPRTLDDLGGMRAARWIRESTGSQLDRYGPAAQREQQDRAIDQWGLVDTGLIWQIAHSGRTIASTQAFADMSDAAGQTYDVLLVGYVSRFARDLRTAVNARHHFHDRGAVLLFCDERLLSSDETGWETWAREAVEAEGYSRRLARRISEGYAAKFRAGDQGGSPGLGFVRTPAPDSRLAINPATMPRAVALFERYAAGSASYRDLEAETGIPADAIRAILGNPLYNGWAVRHRRSPNERRIAAPWRLDPPVNDDLWARVQRFRADRHTGGGGQPKRIHPLAGRLWCTCGRRIRADVATPRGYVYRRYRHDVGCGAWSQKTYGAETFEGPIGRQIAGIRLNAVMLAQLRSLAGRVAPERDSVDLRQRELQRALEAAAVAFAQRRLSLEAFTSEQARLNTEIDALGTAPAPPARAGVDPDTAIAALRDLKATWRDADDAARARLAAAIFERIVVADDRILEEELTPYARRHGLAVALPEYMDLARPAGIEPAT